MASTDGSDAPFVIRSSLSIIGSAIGTGIFCVLEVNPGCSPTFEGSIKKLVKKQKKQCRRRQITYNVSSTYDHLHCETPVAELTKNDRFEFASKCSTNPEGRGGALAGTVGTDHCDSPVFTFVKNGVPVDGSFEEILFDKLTLG